MWVEWPQLLHSPFYIQLHLKLINAPFFTANSKILLRKHPRCFQGRCIINFVWPRNSKVLIRPSWILFNTWMNRIGRRSVSQITFHILEVWHSTRNKVQCPSSIFAKVTGNRACMCTCSHCNVQQFENLGRLNQCLFLRETIAPWFSCPTPPSINSPSSLCRHRSLP